MLAAALALLDAVVRRWRGARPERAAVDALVDGLLLVSVFVVVLATLWPSGEHGEHSEVNLVPLVDVLDTRDGVVNLVGNVALFAPLGLLAPIRFPVLRSVWRVGAGAAAVSALIEALQYLLLTGRHSDINDIIFNTTGALVGYAVLALWRAG